MRKGIDPSPNIHETLAKLDKTNDIKERLSHIDQFCNIIKLVSINDENFLRTCWNTVKDLLKDEKTSEYAFKVMISIIEGQFDKIGLVQRKEFIDIINSANVECELKIICLEKLTNDGRDIFPFDKEISDLLVEWIGNIPYHAIRILNLTKMIIKCNTSIMNNHISKILTKIYDTLDNTSEDYLQEIINIYDVIAIYSTVSSNYMDIFIQSLCKIVIKPKLLKKALSIMDILMKSSSGIMYIKHLCSILDSELQNSNILRGAAIFLGKLIWSYNKDEVNFIHHSALISLKNSLRCGDISVTIDALKAVRRLVTKFGRSLYTEWSIITDILILSYNQLSEDKDDSMRIILLDIIQLVEEQEHNLFLKDDETYIRLVKSLSPLVKESCVLSLLQDIIVDIHPLNENWIGILEDVVTPFFRNEKRINIKLKVLNIIKTIFDKYRHEYSELIFLRTIFLLKDGYKDEDEVAQTSFIDTYFYMCGHITSNKFFTFIDFIYNVIEEVTNITTIRTIAYNINKLFVNRFSTSLTSHIIYVFEKILLLLSHTDETIRHDSLKSILKLTGTSRGPLQYGEVENLFLRNCSKNCQEDTTTIEVLPIEKLLEVLMDRLEKEENFNILKLLSEGLISFLHNRWLFKNIDLNPLIKNLSTLIKEKTELLKTQNDNNINERRLLDNIKLNLNILVACVGHFEEKNDIFYEVHNNVIDCYIFIMETILKKRKEDALIKTCIYSILQYIYYIDLSSRIPKLISILEDLFQNLDESDLNIDRMFYVLEFLLIFSKHTKLLDSSMKYIKNIFQILLYFTDPRRTSPAITNFAFQVLVSWYICCDTKSRFYHYKKLRKEIEKQLSQTKSSILESNSDLLSRLAYSNCDPVSTDSNASILFKKGEKYQTNVWMQGNCIITIRSNETEWVDVTVRRPSGKMSWLIQLQNMGNNPPIINEDITNNYIEYLSKLDEAQARKVPLSFDYSMSNIYDHSKSNSKDNISFKSHNSDNIPYLHPSFVFSQLQLIPYHKATPKLIKSSGANLERALSVLDLTISCETYKIGVIYVYNGQTKQEDILANSHGSPRFYKFMENLGDLVLLKGADFYTGGLDKNDNLDGKYTVLWRNNLMQMVFHVATMMPNYPNDTNFTNKKRHIGNDFVSIVWHDWDNHDYDPKTISGQFNFVTIVIYPLDKGFYRVQLKKKPQIPFVGPIFNCQILREEALVELVRATAMSAHTVCKHFQLNENLLESVSNYEERLRQIKQIGSRFEVDKEAIEYLAGNKETNESKV